MEFWLPFLCFLTNSPEKLVLWKLCMLISGAEVSRLNSTSFLLNSFILVSLGVHQSICIDWRKILKEARRKEFRRKEVKREKQLHPQTIKNELCWRIQVFRHPYRLYYLYLVVEVSKGGHEEGGQEKGVQEEGDGVESWNFSRLKKHTKLPQYQFFRWFGQIT